MLKTLLVAMILMAATGLYDFKLTSLDGKPFDLGQYKGKKILIVNTASACGYTPQYADLEALYEKYKGKLVVIGFPANNFGEQEKGTNTEIATFCKKNYGVTFPMSEKVSVKGDDIAPLFKYLTEEAGTLGETDPIKWNFTKFLVGRDGKVLKRFAPTDTPVDLEKEIKTYLK